LGTLTTSPNALNEVESLTRKDPAGANFNILAASSRDIVGLYQNFDESRANLEIYNKYININKYIEMQKI
jgi:hypothetical protein